MRPPERHLAGISIQTARAILSQIQAVPPVVSVFFELAREPAATSPHGLRAIGLDELARLARQRSSEEVVACLTAMDEALQRVRGEPDAILTALDGDGHCLVADITASAVLALWQEIVAARNLTRGLAPTSDSNPVEPVYATAGGVV
jgi:hypothetical protein